MDLFNKTEHTKSLHQTLKERKKTKKEANLKNKKKKKWVRLHFSTSIRKDINQILIWCLGSFF